MAKKKPTKTKSKRRMSPDEVHLLKLIEVSEKQITNQGLSLDELFTQQANRLKKELADLRKK